MKSTVAKNAAAETSRRNSGPSGVLPRVPPVVNEVLSSHGQPLDSTTSHDMGSRFGHDFSKVRIHADNRAAEAAEALNSHAFTIGADIVFGSGQYSPQTNAGRRLLAHELTHVVQQHKGGDAVSSEVELNPSNHYEQEAHTVAETLTANGRSAIAPRISAAPPSIQRVATWQYGTVTENLNLAERFVSGHKHAGQTLFLLNGKPITASTNATTALSYLNLPTFTSTPRADGKGVDCALDTLPTNEGTYETNVITADRWQVQTTKPKLGALFPRLRACARAGGGDSIFTIKDNQDVATNTRLHEETHAYDDKQTFLTTVVPWDKKLTDAKTNNVTMAGTNDTDCQTKFYSASTKQHPAALIKAIINDINTRARTFHGTAAGRDVNIYDAEANEECNAVRAKAR
jgi:hypothetical protein